MRRGGEQETQPAGPLAASCQLQQAADALQHRRHPEQAVGEAELRHLRHGPSHLVLREAPSFQPAAVQPRTPHANLSSLCAGGAGQQDLQRAGSQRAAGCGR